MAVIALCGFMGSGKSEVARHLVERHGFVLMKFAGPLKQMLRALLREAGCDEVRIDRMIDGDLKEVPCEALCGQTPRWAMQSLGTEWGRGCIGTHLWVGAAMSRIMASRQPVVVDDCRFLNEARAIRAAGGVVWRIDRGLASSAAHASESGQSELPLDATIMNTGSLESLRALVDDQMASYIALHGNPHLSKSLISPII